MNIEDKIEWFMSRTRYNAKAIGFYAQKGTDDTYVFKDKEGNTIIVRLEVSNERD